MVVLTGIHSQFIAKAALSQAFVVGFHILNIDKTSLTYTAPNIYGRRHDHSEFSVSLIFATRAK